MACGAQWPGELGTYHSNMREFRDRYPYGVGVRVAAPNWSGFEKRGSRRHQ